MTIPDYQTLMRPVLVSLKDSVKNTNEVVNDLKRVFNLSDEDMKIMQGSGRDTTIRNRTQWSFKYLYEAKLLEKPERGKYKTSARGLKVLDENPERVDNTILEQFDEFNKWKHGLNSGTDTIDENLSKSNNKELQTPEEKLRSSHSDLKKLTQARFIK